MKKKTFLALALALTCISCAEAQHSLTVRLGDLTSDTLKIMVYNKEMKDVEVNQDLIRHNGEFTFDFNGNKARYALLKGKTADGPITLRAFLVPGEHGTMTGTTELAKWSGSKFYSQLADIEKTTDPIEDQMAALMQDYKAKVSLGANKDSLQKVVGPEYDAMEDRLTEARIKFIAAHPKDDVSASFFFDLMDNMDDAEKAMNLIDPTVKAGAFSDIVTCVQGFINQEKARKIAMKNVADGCMAPDFTLKDIKGKPLKLSSLRGKYLVLDFWGSWCIWCIRGMPEMKKYYEKYKGKFEILGVDCNDTPEKWKAAVEKNQLPWKHVYNPKTSNVCKTYAIQGYPTKIIIDPKGKIVKTIVGEDPSFYTTLDDLLK